MGFGSSPFSWYGFPQPAQGLPFKLARVVDVVGAGASMINTVDQEVGYLLGGADASALSPSATAQTFYVQTKKGGFGNPFDDHRNTQLALRVTF